MELNEVMQQLEAMGTEQTRKTWRNHGAKEPMFGVKVGDMKLLVKKIQHNQDLALQLFETGNADAQYFAGLIATPSVFSKNQLQNWAEKGTWTMVSEYTVAWMAAESPHGWEMGNLWIQSDKETVATSGWTTLSNCLALKNDADLNIEEIDGLLEFVVAKIHTSPNRVRYTMNGFVIAVGAYILPLVEKAKMVARKIGKVSVEMDGTACKVPLAFDYIEKIEKMGRVGQKKKTVIVDKLNLMNH
jgi:3-methyladenine DNA glycosylase AlkD